MVNLINTLKGFKTLAALGLIVCLFLPLSTCSTPSDSRLKKEEVVYERYVVMHKDHGFKAYVPIVFFVLPIIVVLLNIKIQREKLRFELLEFMTGLIALVVVLVHWKTGKLVLGGYLAISSSIIYLLATLAEMWSTINYRRHDSDASLSNNVESEEA